MSERLQILLIDPIPEIASMLIDSLSSDGHDVHHVTEVISVADEADEPDEPDEADEAYQSAYDVVIAAWSDGASQEGQRTLDLWRRLFAGTPLVLAVDAKDVGLAANMLTCGVWRYLLRPYVLTEIRSISHGIGQIKQTTLIEEPRGHEITLKSQHQVEEFAQSLEALFAVGTEIVATLEEPAVLQKIVNAVVETLAYRVVYFRIIEPNGNTVIRACAGTDGNYVENPAYTLKPNQGLTGEALGSRTPLQVKDVCEDERFALPEMAQREGLHGVLVVPLILEGQRIIGTLACYTGHPHHFSADEVNLVTAFANLAAVALTNARQVGQFHRLEQAGKALASVIRLDEVKEAIAQQVLQLTAADGAFVCLYDSAAKRFDLERAVSVGLGEGLLATRAWHLCGINRWGKSEPRPGGIVERIMREGVVFVADLSNRDEQKPIGPKAQRQLQQAGIRAFVGLRLQVGEELVGALFLNYSHPYRESDSKNKQYLFKIYAHQAALAVIRARLFEREQQEQALIQSVAAATSSMEDIEGTWQQLLDGAMNLTRAEIGYIGLLNEAKNSLNSVAHKGYSGDLLAKEYKIGGPSIVAWVAQHKQTVLVKNVQTQKPWSEIYFAGVLHVRSHLTVPIKRGNSQQLVGVMTVESPREGAFNADDQQLLEDLAVQADIALQNAQLYADVQRRAKQSAEQYEELQKTKDELLASQAVAWLGLFGAEWQHAINQKTFSISTYVNGLRSWFKKQDLPARIMNELFEVLDDIEEVTEEIRSVQFTSQVPADISREVDGQTVLDDELPKIVARWCSGRQDVKQILELNCPEVAVKILPQWIKVALEKLINNALKAMAHGGKLTVATRLKGDQVAITIKDTGHGLPDLVRKYFLKRVIPRRKGKVGMGMGALIARFIALSHGGDLTLIESIRNQGTELCMTLRVAKDS